MKPSGHTAAMPRCMLVLSAILPAVALKMKDSNLPTQPKPRDSPSQSSASSFPKTSKARDAHPQNLSLPSKPISQPSVTVTSWCIVAISCQFMLIYAALAVCRTYHEIKGSPKGRIESSLTAASQTLTYGPMLCALFLACQMRVEYLSDGKDQPQGWVQNCMIGLTVGVLASTLLVFVLQNMAGKPIVPKDNPFDIEGMYGEETQNAGAFYALSFVRYSVLFALYGGLAGVLVGMCTYVPPGITTLREISAPSPAVMCTMVLSIVFFSTQLIVAVCRSYMELTRVRFPQIIGVMHAASASVEFAPMLAVLFLGARMRAEQHDTHPQEWSHDCMFIATGAMCVTTLLAIMVPLTLGGAVKKNPWTHTTIIEVPKPFIGYVFIGMRYLCMLCFYGGAAGVVVSIFTFQSPGGPMATLPVSPAAQCVISLSCQFFFIYFVWTLMLTASELTGSVVPMETWSLFSALEAARSTLSFAPMLSLLFVVTRMHALLLTEKIGAPQAWVQDGMYLATWSLQIAGLMCLGIGLFMGKVNTNYDGNVVSRLSNHYIGTIVIAIRYLSMLLLYGGMIMVIAGLFTLTRENAVGRGSIADVYGGVGAPNEMPFASRSSRIAISTVHSLVQMGTL